MRITNHNKEMEDLPTPLFQTKPCSNVSMNDFLISTEPRTQAGNQFR